MECPDNHEWYELARGTASHEKAQRLRRHLDECAECRARADAIGKVAASLEGLEDHTRLDMSEQGAQAMLERARARKLVGSPARRSILSLIQNPPRHMRRLWYLMPLAGAAAAVFLLAILMQPEPPTVVQPPGSLERLAMGAARVTRTDDLKRLAPTARAAVSEELARPKPVLEQVGDLALVAYIIEHVRTNRQIGDVRFLVEGVRQKRAAEGPALASTSRPAMLATIGATPAELPRAGTGLDALTRAKSMVLRGEYRKALDEMPTDASARLLRAWCLDMIGRESDAAVELAQSDLGTEDGAIARVLRADLAIQGSNVAEAMREYEALAAAKNRFWFGAGYLCRYELGDPRGAGLRFMNVEDERLARYIRATFKADLEAARLGTKPIFFEDFKSYAVGAIPSAWRLVKTRKGEFTIVQTAGGRALQADELKGPGSEILTGSSDWADYTYQMDVKVVETEGDYLVGAAICRATGDLSGYVLELTPNRLRLLKQFPGEGAKAPQRLLIEPPLAQVHLHEAPTLGWWYTLKVRVQHVGDGTVTLAGKMWRSDVEEPIAWQVTWTDPGQGDLDPWSSGFVGIQARGARILVSKLSVTRNELPHAAVAAGK